MPRRWSGTIVVEGVQTGDGRYIVPGAVTWSDLPLPVGFIRDGDQHVGLVEVAPQIGIIETIVREGGNINATGIIDDEHPDGAELCRRMDAGTGSHGHAFFVSIDPDDFAVELVVADPGEDDEDGLVILAAAGHARHGWAGVAATVAALTASARRPVLVSAAGDGDPVDDGGEVLFEASADELIERYTRLRIRGVTACSVSAFDGAFITLDAVEADPAVAAAAVEQAVQARVFASATPASWFADPGLEEPTPLTIDDDGRVFGHVAAWDVCHTGYLDRCVTAPRQGSYASFLTGSEHTDSGRTAVGVLTWGIPHADLSASMVAAQQHYADSRAGWAHVASGEDEHGLWVAGSVLPGVTSDDVRILRGLSLSGDWRWSVQHKALNLIAALAVNYPGFPIPRSLSAASMTVAAGGPAQVWLEDDGRVLALVASGMVAPAGEPCGCGEMTLREQVPDRRVDEALTLLHRLDLRTRHLIPTAVAAAAARLDA